MEPLTEKKVIELLEKAAQYKPDNTSHWTLTIEEIKMYEIKDYKYINGVTIITWDDGSITTVKPEEGTEPDQYVGFITAYAKKACGNTGRINYLFEKWAIKKPKAEEKAAREKEKAEIEKKRIAEVRKVKKEKWLVKKRTKEIQREYEARKLAYEKYGIPLDENK